MEISSVSTNKAVNISSNTADIDKDYDTLEANEYAAMARFLQEGNMAAYDQAKALLGQTQLSKANYDHGLQTPGQAVLDIYEQQTALNNIH